MERLVVGIRKMGEGMRTIQYIKHNKIDKKRWDDCIKNSPNGLVYAYSFFLDIMADKRWDALVMGDYEAVFPLVWNRKFGLKYLYQPYFCQQLGLFCRTEVREELLHDFIRKIPRKFVYWDFHLNYSNNFFSPDIQFVNRTSFTIDLNQDYLSIYDKFNSDAKKNLAKAALAGYNLLKPTSAQSAADCFFDAYGIWYAQPEKLKNKILACATKAIDLNLGFCLEITGKDGQLWCSGFFFISHNRIHYAMAAPTELGKKIGATHVLIDEVLKAYSDTHLTFDFEGSDLKNVAYFYSKFGSVKKHYLEIIRNRLPWWIQAIKK
ncbi:MAG: hypothetical protein JNM67_02190 [Bacteroidetes bacterium]|nr:hypothetical protein [Bacteroidota bacterium]